MIQVMCVFCGESIELNEDTAETRKAGIDPSQQLRKHILECHGGAITVGRNAGWLLDRLAFRSSDQEKWRESCIKVLDWLMAGGIVNPE